MQLTIKVGAAVDRSLNEAYKPLIESAKKATKLAQTEAAKAGQAVAKEAKKGADEAAKAMTKAAKEGERAQRQQVRDAEKAERDKTRAVEAAEKNRQRIRERSATMAGQFAVAEAKREAREVEKALKSAKRTNASNMRTAGRVGSAVVGAGGSAARAALGFAGSMARGAGVELDVGSMFAKNAALETAANKVSNSGYMAGDARNGRRVGSRELMNESLQVASQTGMDASDVMEGLDKFVGLTGDLKTGRDVMKDLLVLSKATGTTFDDMAAAAGNVANALPDTADKGEKIKTVMAAVAGMGKVGAVEIKDLAKEMAKLAANAGAFGGDASKNMITLTAMAQESRASGGSASATQAATSVASFVSMLKTPKRAKEFEKATGAKVYDEKTGKLNDPQTIIKQALTAVGTDPLKLKTIFANVQGSRAMEGFATKFRDAGGGEAGLKAVDAEFERLRNSMIAQEEITESFNRSMKTGQSQADVFNTEMQRGALAMQDALYPAMIALAPSIIEATKATAGFITWLTGKTPGMEIVGEAKKDVGNAIASTDKQLAGGKISDAQLEQNKTAEKKAFEAAARTAAVAKSKKDGEGGFSGIEKAFMVFMDNQAIGLAGRAVNGGQGLGEKAINKDDASRAAAAVEAAKAQELLKSIHTENEKVSGMLAKGIVVRVSADSAPVAPPGGRQPDPNNPPK